MSWSSGKDSAWALHTLRQQPDVEVRALLTTFNQAADRVAMHAVRSELVRAQAAATGLPLWEIALPWPCSNEEYESRMGAAVARARSEGFTHVAFGDLFLDDVRRYREERLAGTGLDPLFPLWGLPTDLLARQMIASGIRAVLTCVDPRCMPRQFAGRDFDEALLADLPADVDRCGERGEFHTFVWDGPMFARPLPIEHGVIVERDGFIFADVMPAGRASTMTPMHAPA